MLIAVGQEPATKMAAEMAARLILATSIVSAVPFTDMAYRTALYSSTSDLSGEKQISYEKKTL